MARDGELYKQTSFSTRNTSNPTLLPRNISKRHCLRELHVTTGVIDYSTMQRFLDTNRISQRNQERNDCVVITTAIATGQPYGRVLELFAKEGRKRRRGVAPLIAFRVLRTLGYGLHVMYESSPAIKLPTAGRLILPRVGTYIVQTATHWYAVVDGQIEDNYAIQHPRIRVQKVWRVVSLTKGD